MLHMCAQRADYVQKLIMYIWTKEGEKKRDILFFLQRTLSSSGYEREQTMHQNHNVIMRAQQLAGYVLKPIMYYIWTREVKIERERDHCRERYQAMGMRESKVWTNIDNVLYMGERERERDREQERVRERLLLYKEHDEAVGTRERCYIYADSMPSRLYTKTYYVLHLCEK